MYRKLFLLTCFALMIALASANVTFGQLVVESRISVGDDDMEQYVGGAIDPGSSDLEFPYESKGMVKAQVLGLRFLNIAIPAGATIVNAWVEFEVDELKDGSLPVSLIVEGELSPNAGVFAASADVVSRPRTTAKAVWVVANWTAVDAKDRTSNIASVIQEIVNQAGWVSGNALVLIISDDPANPSTGNRCAEAYEGEAANAPLLHIEYEEAAPIIVPTTPTWTNTDVGTPLAGSASYDEATGTWTVTGDGKDIWDNADNFHYVYRYMKGDGEMIARVTGISPGTDPWVKAGVMIRDTLDAGAKNAFVAISGGSGDGATFQWRANTGGSSSSSRTLVGIAPPAAVKLVRQGNTFTGYVLMGDQWQQEGTSATITMQDPVYIGLAVTSHLDGELRTATIDNVSLIGDVYDVQLTAHNPAPADAAVNVPVDAILSWVPGDTAATHDVYFGTSSPPALVGNQAEASYDPGFLKVATTYYWQVNEVEADGVTRHEGPIWSFTASPTNILIHQRITDPNDDAEQHVGNGNMDITSTDLELAYEDAGTPATDEQVNALRYNVALPKGAIVTNAYVEFEVDSVSKVGSAEPVNLIIEGELTAAPFVNVKRNITDRTSLTTAKVKWSIPPWTATNVKYQTPDISSVIQEIISQDGWASGNALILIFRDDKENPSTGLREAESVEGEAAAAPLLHIDAIYEKATNPNPANGATQVAADATLSWRPGASATIHSVYFGTNSPPAPVGLQTAASYNPGPLQGGTTYYWQIDEVAANGTMTTGDIWSFTTVAIIVIDNRIATANDDVEERLRPDRMGDMDMDSSDLEFPYEDFPIDDLQRTGLRFVNVALPKGALVTNAYIEFEVDEVKGGTSPANVIINGELTPDAAPFVKSPFNILLRPSWTTAVVNWSVPNWTTVSEKFQTPDISSIIQEIVNQEGWVSGNALVLSIYDDPANPSTGVRCAEAYEGEAANAPLLHITAISQ